MRSPWPAMMPDKIGTIGKTHGVSSDASPARTRAMSASAATFAGAAFGGVVMSRMVDRSGLGPIIIMPAIAIPFVVRTVVPVMRTIRSRLREAARVLGASPLRAWREVDLPLIARSGLVAAGFAFAISLGEFGASAFLVRPERPTLPVAIFRLLGRPGELNFGRAMALSTILMVLTAVSIMTIERFRVGEAGEF